MNLYEKKLDEKEIFNGRIIRVHVDDVELPNGHKTIREVVEHHGGVCVAPLTDDDELFFVKQYRYTFGEELLELPAGKLEKDENPYDAGIRELSEECGITADKVIPMGVIYPTVAYCSEKIYMYCARGLHFSSQHLDDDEFLEISKIKLDKALEMVMNNEIQDSKTVVLILKIAKLRQEGKI